MPRKKNKSPAEVSAICNTLDDIIFDDDFSELDKAEEKQKRLYAACVHKIATSYKYILKQLDDPYEAREILKELLKSPLSKLPKRGGRPSKEERDRKLRAKHDEEVKHGGPAKKIHNDQADETLAKEYGLKNVGSVRATVSRARSKVKSSERLYKEWAQRL